MKKMGLWRRARFVAAAILVLLVGTTGVVVGSRLYEPLTRPQGVREQVIRLTERYFGASLVQDSGVATDTRSCVCARRWDACPCGAFGPSPSDSAIYQALDDDRPAEPVKDRDFAAKLSRAFGYENIRPAADSMAEGLRTGRKGPFGDNGTVEEVFLDYARPQVQVRGLFAHAGSSSGRKGLILMTPGSWTTPEQMLGLAEEDYHRVIGRRMFDAGYDVVAFDHGGNGVLETFLNVMTTMEGTNVLAIWIRSMCDVRDIALSRWGYQDVYLYGLSRAAYLVELASNFCDPVSRVIVDDNLFPDRLRDVLWDASDSIMNLKYGAWYFGPGPAMPWQSFGSVIASSRSPLLYLRTEAMFAAQRDVFGQEFDLRQGVRPEDRVVMLYKAIPDHVSEVEQIIAFLGQDTTSLRGFALVERD